MCAGIMMEANKQISAQLLMRERDPLPATKLLYQTLTQKKKKRSQTGLLMSFIREMQRFRLFLSFSCPLDTNGRRITRIRLTCLDRHRPAPDLKKKKKNSTLLNAGCRLIAISTGVSDIWELD